ISFDVGDLRCTKVLNLNGLVAC
ncbi:hypothetical protein JI435_308780, partial [Parastagonospora nodorum SN15]